MATTQTASNGKKKIVLNLSAKAKSKTKVKTKPSFEASLLNQSNKTKAKEAKEAKTPKKDAVPKARLTPPEERIIPPLEALDVSSKGDDLMAADTNGDAHLETPAETIKANEEDKHGGPVSETQVRIAVDQMVRGAAVPVENQQLAFLHRHLELKQGKRERIAKKRAQKKFVRIVFENNGDTLDGFPIQNGSKMYIRLADGTVLKKMVYIDFTTPPGRPTWRRAWFNVMFHDHPLKVYLDQLSGVTAKLKVELSGAQKVLRAKKVKKP